jgi:hypothetical protein
MDVSYFTCLKSPFVTTVSFSECIQGHCDPHPFMSRSWSDVKQRFAEAPTGLLRWEPPVPFVSSQIQNATSLAPSCVQQFPFASRDFFMNIFNTPGPVDGESEDCLFLYVLRRMILLF